MRLIHRNANSKFDFPEALAPLQIAAALRSRNLPLDTTFCVSSLSSEVASRLNVCKSLIDQEILNRK